MDALLGEALEELRRTDQSLQAASPDDLEAVAALVAARGKAVGVVAGPGALLAAGPAALSAVVESLAHGSGFMNRLRLVRAGLVSGLARADHDRRLLSALPHESVKSRIDVTG